MMDTKTNRNWTDFRMVKFSSIVSESYQETVPRQVAHAPSSTSAQDGLTSVSMGSDLPSAVSQGEEDRDYRNPGPSSPSDEGN